MRTWILLGLVLSGCEGPPTRVDCAGADPANVSGTASAGDRLAPVDSTLEVEGTADHAGGLAIRSIEVGGIPATSTSFNYGQWSAEVPWEVLSELAGDGTSATLAVVATDACEQSVTLSELSVEVSPIPGGEVTRLGLDVELPGELGWLPADGTTPALVRVRANPEARGTAVDVLASLGDLDGADGARLAGDGLADAETTLLFTSTTAGSAILTANADDRLATGTIRVVGPPALLPAVVELDPGERASLTAQSEGEVASCTAVADPGIAITSGGVDLTRSEAAVDANGDGHPDILVQTSEQVAGGSSAVVRCSDAFGQVGLSTVRVP